MDDEDNFALLAEGIWVRGQRERASTNREFIVLSAEVERACRPAREEHTQPIKIVDVA